MINEQRRRFAVAYVELGRIREAATVAGYSKQYAEKKAYKLLEDKDVKAYIDKLLEEINSKKIAKAEEVLIYLTSVLRGESEAEEIVIEGDGQGYSSARVMTKGPSQSERTKAAELLGKRYSLYTDKVEAIGDMTLNISVDYGDKPDPEDEEKQKIGY